MRHVTKFLAASAEAKRQNTEPRDPVLRLLLTRVRGHLLARLQAGSASEKVKITTTAGEKLAGLGLPEFVEKVREIDQCFVQSRVPTGKTPYEMVALNVRSPLSQAHLSCVTAAPNTDYSVRKSRRVS